nr:hypothetical protein [Yersinia rochesterensis]
MALTTLGRGVHHITTLLNEQRFRRLNTQEPDVAARLYAEAEKDLKKRYDFLSLLAGKPDKTPTE